MTRPITKRYAKMLGREISELMAELDRFESIDRNAPYGNSAAQHRAGLIRDQIADNKRKLIEAGFDEYIPRFITTQGALNRAMQGD